MSILEKAVSIVNDKYLNKRQFPKSRLSKVSYPSQDDTLCFEEIEIDVVDNKVVDVKMDIDMNFDDGFINIVRSLKPLRAAPSLPIDIPKRKV